MKMILTPYMIYGVVYLCLEYILYMVGTIRSNTDILWGDYIATQLYHFNDCVGTHIDWICT